MPDESFEAGVAGGLLRGSIAGTGDPLLVLHGGPGLLWTYLQPLLAELAGGYRVAAYQHEAWRRRARALPMTSRRRSPTRWRCSTFWAGSERSS